ncbi:MAG TPA: hypothetical protein VIT68_03130 [Candidatus Gracilibacteria bacterium]
MIEIASRFDELLERPHFELSTIKSHELLEALGEPLTPNRMKVIPIQRGDEVFRLCLQKDESESGNTSVVLRDSLESKGIGAAQVLDSDYHYYQEVDARFGRQGVGSLVRTVLEKIERALDFESCASTDSLLFDLRRGYAPIGMSEPDAGEDWNSLFCSDHREFLGKERARLILALKYNQITRNTIAFEWPEFTVRSKYDPSAARAFWAELEQLQNPDFGELTPGMNDFRLEP